MKTASFCIMKLTAEQVKRRSGTVKRLGGKDIAEKTLEAYNEVFADIVNVLLFDGERMIRPEDLEEQTPRSIYKADGKLREIERDVAKKWIRNNIRIACIGLENQTETDRYMPLRVMGSDAADYRNQLRNLKKGKKPAAVVTLVLYFGYQGHWNAPTSLIEAMEVPEVLKPYVTNGCENQSFRDRLSVKGDRRQVRERFPRGGGLFCTDAGDWELRSQHAGAGSYSGCFASTEYHGSGSSV